MHIPAEDAVALCCTCLRRAAAPAGCTAESRTLVSVLQHSKLHSLPAGESEAKVRQLFQDAISAAPCIVFIGELLHHITNFSEGLPGLLGLSSCSTWRYTPQGAVGL